MSSPLPPRLRDTTSIEDRVSQDRRNLKQLNVGFVGGRFPLARPIGSRSALAGVEDDTGEAESLIGEDGDRLTLGSVYTQTWLLSAAPIDETLVVRWHPDGGAGVEWKRGTHYTLDDQTVSFTQASLVAAGALVGDVFSAQYLKVAGDSDSESYTIPYSDAGWSYLVLSGDRDTNTTNHSTDDFSTWPTGAMPIGIAGSGPISPSTSHAVTTTSAEIFWVARSFPATDAMTIKLVLEDNGTVYVNGTMVLDIPEHGSGSWPEQTIVVDPDLLRSDSENVVTMKVANETPVVNAGCYVDISLVATASA